MTNRAPEKLAKILATLGEQKSKSYANINADIKSGIYRKDRAARDKKLEYINKHIADFEKKLARKAKKGETLAQQKGYEEKIKKLKALKTILEEETNVENSSSSANSTASAKTAATAKTAKSGATAKSKKSPATKKLSVTQKLKMIKDIVC